MRPIPIIVAWSLVSLAAQAAPDARDTAAPPPHADCLRADVNDDENRVLMAKVVDVCSQALQDQKLPSSDRAEAYLNRGLAHRHLGKLERSLADLLKAKDLAPKDANVARMLAWTYREMDRQDEAEREYDRSLLLDPHWQAYLSRCVVRIDRDEFAKALNDCETADRQHRSEDSLYFVAFAYQNLGRHAEIPPLIEPHLEGPWASGRLYRILSEAYASGGRKADATRLLEIARRRFPRDSELNKPPPGP